MNKPASETDLKRRNLRGILRLFLFSLCFLAILIFANFNLIETDLISGSTIRELQSRDDIEVAFVGSSVVLFQINPAIIREETGLTSYNCAIHSASIQADLTITEEMFKTSHPKYIVLTLEPYVLNSAKESLEAEFRMAPFLTGVKTLVNYYLNTSRIDHRYLDRALIFRNMYPHSLRGIIKTHDTKKDAGAALVKYASLLNDEETYMGAGYIRHNPSPENLQEEIRSLMYRLPYEGNYYPLLPDTVELLNTYRSYVESMGAQLVVIVCPNHTSHPLSVPAYLPYTQSLLNFCREENIPCFNFQYAKPELMPCMDEYFYDVYHMCGEGSDILTAAICRVFNAWRAGEDVSDLFYPNDWMYQDSLNVITNTWVWPTGKDTFLADCNMDWHSTPEYRFVYVDEDGNETLLRDYSDDAALDFIYPGTGLLRVYARRKGDPQDPRVYYDYPVDFEYAARMMDYDFDF